MYQHLEMTDGEELILKVTYESPEIIVGIAVNERGACTSVIVGEDRFEEVEYVIPQDMIAAATPMRWEGETRYGRRLEREEF